MLCRLCVDLTVLHALVPWVICRCGKVHSSGRCAVGRCISCVSFIYFRSAAHTYCCWCHEHYQLCSCLAPMHPDMDLDLCITSIVGVCSSFCCIVSMSLAHGSEWYQSSGRSLFLLSFEYFQQLNRWSR